MANSESAFLNIDLYCIEELEKWLQMIYEEEHLYHDRMLAVTAVIVEEMRTAVYEKTGYRCSAGIAHNKVIALLIHEIYIIECVY